MIKRIFIALLLAILLFEAIPESASANTLAGWRYYRDIVIDNTNVSSDQTDYPVLLKLSTSSGIGTGDLTSIFTEIASSDNRFKIAVTSSDGITQLYVEVVSWDTTNKYAELWIKVPTVATASTTTIRLYYDHTHADNTAYVGATGSTPAKAVWDSSYKLVQHRSHVWGDAVNAVMPETGPEDSTITEPTVIVEGGALILSGTVFKMWYRYGWDTSLVGYAESLDGITWTKYSGNPILSGNPVDQPSVYKDGSTYYLTIRNSTTQGTDLLTSTNGVNFTLNTATIIPKGTGGDWDNAFIANTTMWKEGTNSWYMLYEAGTATSNLFIGLATATAASGPWTKYVSNPVLTTYGGGPGSVRKVNGVYYLWTWGGAAGNYLPTDIFRQSSTNLINWTLSPSGVAYPRATKDEGIKAALSQVADVEVIEYNGNSYMYYCANTAGNVKTGISHIKVAVANMPLSELVLSQENADIDSTSNANNAYVYGAYGTHSLGNVDMTLEMKLKTPSTVAYLFGGWPAPTPAPNVQFVVGTDYPNKLSMYSNASGARIVSTSTVADNIEHYVAFRDSAETMQLFVAGLQEDTGNAGATTWDNWHWDLQFADNVWFPDPIIKEIRISNIARSANYIKANQYNFTDALVTYGTEQYIPPTPARRRRAFIF